MYNIISRTKVQEPNRGQNYSEFYFTTYIVVNFQDVSTIEIETLNENNEIIISQQEVITERTVDFKFFEETEEEIISTIENYIA